MIHYFLSSNVDVSFEMITSADASNFLLRLLSLHGGMLHMAWHKACHLKMDMKKCMETFTLRWHDICGVPRHLGMNGFIHFLKFVFKRHATRHAMCNVAPWCESGLTACTWDLICTACLPIITHTLNNMHQTNCFTVLFFLFS